MTGFKFYIKCVVRENASVAQLDRVLPSEGDGHGSDSRRKRQIIIANVAKLVDALGSGLSVERHEGSSPSIRTIISNFDCQN